MLIGFIVVGLGIEINNAPVLSSAYPACGIDERGGRIAEAIGRRPLRIAKR